MSTSHHGRRGAVKAAQAAGGVLAFISLAEAAHVISVLTGSRGLIAGATLVSVVFAACWIIHQARPALRLTRPARDCAPVAQAGNTSTDPAHPDLLPVL